MRLNNCVCVVSSIAIFSSIAPNLGPKVELVYFLFLLLEECNDDVERWSVSTSFTALLASLIVRADNPVSSAVGRDVVGLKNR